MINNKKVRARQTFSVAKFGDNNFLFFSLVLFLDLNIGSDLHLNESLNT